MKTKHTSNIRILALDPTWRGFGYVVLESPRFLVHWGEAFVRRPEKNRGSVQRVTALLERYRPDYLVLEDTRVRASRRSPRVRAPLCQHPVRRDRLRFY